MKNKLLLLFQEMLSRNKGPGYGITITSITPDMTSVAVELTFLAGRKYCCSEPFCHVPQDATKIVRFAKRHGVSLPLSFQVNWHFILEEGALLSSIQDVGGPPSNPKRQEYDAISKA